MTKTTASKPKPAAAKPVTTKPIATKAAVQPAEQVDATPTPDMVKYAFEQHPTVNEVYETSDGFTFLKDGDAQLHARSLDAKNITLHLRSNFVSTDAVTDIPAITKVQMHEGAVAGTSSKTVTGGEIILPLSEEAKEKLKVATNANGEAITSTEALVDNPGEGTRPADGETKETVQTAGGEGVANSDVKTD